MHQICYDNFPISTPKERIEKVLNDRAERDGDGGGLYARIRFVDLTFDSEEEAGKYIQANDTGWYDQLAVKYRLQKDFKPSKALSNLKARVAKAHTEYNNLACNFHFANHKSEFIGCKRCGSKISLKYLRRNACPVCGFDMRPKTTLDKIEALKLNYDELQKAAHDKEHEERMKSIKKAETFWLVKTEYHC